MRKIYISSSKLCLVFLILCAVSACKKEDTTAIPSGPVAFHQGNRDYAINSVTPTHDGGYLVSGMVTNFSSLDISVFLLKYDKTGKELWYNTYASDLFFLVGIDETSDGGFVVAGLSNLVNIGGANYVIRPVLFKTGPSGTREWIKHMNPDFYYSSIVADTKGFFYLSGSYGSNSDNYIYKLKNNGDSVWYKSFISPGPGNNVNALKMIVDNTGAILMASTEGTGTSVFDLHLLKFDIAGNLIAHNDIFPRYNAPYMTYIFNTFSQRADGTYNIIFNAANTQNIPVPFAANCLMDISTDINLKVLNTKRIDSLIPKPEFVDINNIYSKDNLSVFCTDIKGGLYETLPDYSFSSTTEKQGKFTLLRKSTGGQVLFQKTFYGWPYSMYRDAENHIFIAGLSLNPSSESRGLFKLYLDENGELIK